MGKIYKRANLVEVVGNVKNFDAIRNEMRVIDELDVKVLESLRAVLEMFSKSEVLAHKASACFIALL